VAARKTLRPENQSVNFPADMGRLTTHALDLSRGTPARGLEIELWRVNMDGRPYRLKTIRTNADGRTDEPVLNGAEFVPGTYELIFFVGDYFGLPDAERFLDRVPVRFSISDAGAHYHVPLLTTPWAYQTYRGS